MAQTAGNFSLTLVIGLTFWIALIQLTFAQDAKTAATQPQPLVFYYDKQETVRIIWDPTMNIKKVLEVAQREVAYKFDKATGGPKPEHQQWRVLVKEQDGHDASRRYAFVKDDHCRELQFKLGWRTKDGKEYKDVIQTLKPKPVHKALGSKITVQPATFNKGANVVNVKLDWKADVSKYAAIKTGDVSAELELESCNTIFAKIVPKPKLSNNGRSIDFDPRYATHGCKFSVNIVFPTFDKKDDCSATYRSNSKESAHIKLDCKSIAGLDCPKLDYGCKMDCSPKLSIKPHFKLEGNDTLAYAETSWKFGGDGKGAKGVMINYFHSWLNYQNQAFEIENVTTKKIPKKDGDKVLLQMLSVTPQAMWVVKVCQLYADCPNVPWNKVPAYPVWYYPFHDERPPWHKAGALNAPAQAANQAKPKGGKKGVKPATAGKAVPKAATKAKGTANKPAPKTKPKAPKAAKGKPKSN